MRAQYYLSALVLLIVALMPMHGHAECEEESFNQASRRRDFEAVQEFVNSKRTILLHEKLKEKDTFLKISGDMRAEFYKRREKQDGINLRGIIDRENGIAVPTITYESVLNLQVDYKCGRNYGQAKIQYDNDVGIPVLDGCRGEGIDQRMFGSGICDDICLRRAWIGYHILEESDIYNFDVEIGRRPLNTVFESYIEFKNRFDGILFRFGRKIKPTSKFYIMGGPFVVDYRSNHWAFIVEVGYFNFLDKKIDMRYSYIDWAQHDTNRCGITNPLGARFKNSQVTVDYNLPEIYKKKAQLYGAFLINTDAVPNYYSNYTLSNIGWYAGFIMGEVKKRGDWAIDISYEYVEAQAVPDSDVSGIDRGNIAKDTLYASNGNKRGKANYKGWEFQLLYAITDKVSTNIIYDISHAANPSIGGTHFFSKFEVDIILAF